MSAHFRPEFLNRIDEVVIFDRLAFDQLRAIVDIQLDRLRAPLADRDLSLTVTDAAMEHLAELGYDPVYGARPLQRVIRKQLEDRLARPLLADDVIDGQEVHVDLVEGELTVHGTDPTGGDDEAADTDVEVVEVARR